MFSTPFFKNNYKSFTKKGDNYFNFSFSFDLFMPNKFIFFQPLIPFGRFVYHPFFGGHAPGQFGYQTFFRINSFSWVTIFYKGFSFCICVSLVDNIHIIGLSFIIPFGFELYFLRLLLCSLWFNFTSVQFGCPPVCLLIFFLLSNFVTFWIILRFCSFILDLFFSFHTSYRTHWTRMFSM
jgi:hypothetical protein